MNEETNRYALVAGNGKKHRAVSLIDAATSDGWIFHYQAMQALRQLPVGGTCTDDDGDTWERVQ